MDNRTRKRIRDAKSKARPGNYQIRWKQWGKYAIFKILRIVTYFIFMNIIFTCTSITNLLFFNILPCNVIMEFKGVQK